jgi:hypothetical protein
MTKESKTCTSVQALFKTNCQESGSKSRAEKKERKTIKDMTMSMPKKIPKRVKTEKKGTIFSKLLLKISQGPSILMTSPSLAFQL